jgi:SAM-dependent methyltransferase
MHARSAATRQADPDAERRTTSFSKKAHQGVASQLRSAVSKLTWEPKGTTWVDYYTEADHYDEASMAAKETLVSAHLERLEPDLVFDLGANTGRFSRLAAATGAVVVAADIDHGAVEAGWRALTEDPLAKGDLFPIRYDLANPSPGIGWANEERADLAGRGPADVVLALALVHHVAIGNNVPLSMICELLARLGRHAVVEWVPKDDPKVRVLLATREDIFDRYTQDDFEAAAGEHFEVIQRDPVADSGRTLYLLSSSGRQADLAGGSSSGRRADLAGGLSRAQAR